ncbi:MAG: hypothetical protein OXE94_01530 [Aestuariivita sp.]|nr:hypothetical protein [Aestuariivita sp.]MCY4202176.1 hypothetical protein [Aestuariivita sp.]MCY4289813.1 hypothetical protein [Aestuariivita sp.]MCY4347441.1 hypothetical protein [Aestuariivita sp.]
MTEPPNLKKWQEVWEMRHAILECKSMEDREKFEKSFEAYILAAAKLYGSEPKAVQRIFRNKLKSDVAEGLYSQELANKAWATVCQNRPVQKKNLSSKWRPLRN